MRALSSRAVALLSFVFLLLGYAVSVGSIVGIVQNYAHLSVSGAALQAYEQYSHHRDQIFWLIQMLFFSWWIDIHIPSIVRDAVTLYLFFGLTYNRGSFFIEIILKLVSRDKARLGKDDRPMLERMAGAAWRLFIAIVAWPFLVQRQVRNFGNWQGQDIPADLPEEIKELIMRARRAHDVSFLISLSMTVLFSALGVFAFYYWSYLESLPAAT